MNEEAQHVFPSYAIYTPDRKYILRLSISEVVRVYFIDDVPFLFCFPCNVIIYSHFVHRKKLDKIRDGDGISKSGVTPSKRVGVNVSAAISPFF